MTSAEIRPLRDDEVATYVELRNAIDPRTATMPGWVEQHRRSETTVRIVLAHEGDDVVGVGSAQEEADRRGLDVGWLSFGVVPQHRKKWSGRSALPRAVAPSPHARESRVRHVRLD